VRAHCALAPAGVLLAFVASCATARTEEPVEHPRSAPAHPREFWESIASQGFAVPAGESPLELTLELSTLLRAREPHLRDELGYEIAAAWIVRQRLLDPSELRDVRLAWTANLRDGIGEQGTDSVLGRSFSALCLSLIAARDAARSEMSREDFGELLAAALAYLRDERDLRGWQRDVGWIHSCAHTADLLKFLARNKALSPEGQKRILDGIAAKLGAPIDHVYSFGEDERLARAVVSIVARPDFELAAFHEFLAQCAAACKRSRDAPPFDPALFAAEQNVKHCLRALLPPLAAEADPAPDIAAAREALVAALAAL
jgi:hypothetical protein